VGGRGEREGGGEGWGLGFMVCWSRPFSRSRGDFYVGLGTRILTLQCRWFRRDRQLLGLLLHSNTQYSEQGPTPALSPTAPPALPADACSTAL
jgi:hypothetical protein